MPMVSTREETMPMAFLQLNAGPDGVHHPGNIHEIGATRAAALADDGVAMYAVTSMQEEHGREMERARDVNRKRQLIGLPPMPLRLALSPGAETADYRPGQPAGAPLQLPDWRELQRIVDALKAQEDAAQHARSEALKSAESRRPAGDASGHHRPGDPVTVGETGEMAQAGSHHGSMGFQPEIGNVDTGGRLAAAHPGHPSDRERDAKADKERADKERADKEREAKEHESKAKEHESKADKDKHKGRP